MIINYIEKITWDILRKLNIKSAKDIVINEIVTCLGVNLAEIDMDDEISGFFVIKDGVPVIRVNNKQHPARRNFTIAHELGHFVLHKDSIMFVDKEVMLLRDNVSKTGEKLKEREANAFAASLLMPQIFLETEIEKLVSDPRRTPVKYLADIFKVSELAMSIRLTNLDYNIGYF